MSTLVKSRPSKALPGASFLTDGFIGVVFLLLGVGVLLPWNAFINAKPYFQARLCGDNYSIASDIELWFSILYNGASVLTLAVVLILQFIAGSNDKSIRRVSQMIQHPDPAHGSTGYTFYMVMVPLAIYLAVFLFTTVLVFLPFVPPRLFLILTLSGIFICGVCTSVASSGIVGTAGLFDPNVGVNPYFNGQAVGGVLVALANFAATFLNGPSSFLLENCGSSQRLQEDAMQEDEVKCVPYSEVSWATVAYFSLGCVVLAACMLGYTYVDQYKRLVRKNSSFYSSLPSFEDYSVCETDDTEGEEEMQIMHSDMDGSLPDSQQSTSQWRKRDTTSFSSYQNEDTEDPSTHSAVETDNSQESLTRSVWNVVQGPAISLFWTYFVTLAIFPVWTSELSSVQQCHSKSRIRNDLFSPLSFIIFNGGDLVGRMISAEVPFDRIQNLSSKLVLSSIARFIFFLLFLFCAAQSSQFTSWVVHSDIFSWTIQFLFAVTNGAMTNIAFCYAPRLVENSTDPQQVASAILNFSLSFGLLCGSLFSLPFLELVTGHW
jgi:hypothetical protein